MAKLGKYSIFILFFNSKMCQGPIFSFSDHMKLMSLLIFKTNKITTLWNCAATL